MTTSLFTISKDATVEEAIRMLIDRDVSGAPVVDDQGKLIGIISELQLLEAVYTPEVKSQRLRSFMTKDVLTVAEDTLLSDVTNILVLHRIRRVPVLRDGRLVGIITRRDLLRYALEASDTLTMSVNELKTYVGA
jgi:CBS domain-containing protein